MKKLALLCNGNITKKDQGMALYAGKFVESNYSFEPSVDIILNDVEGTSLLNIFLQYDEVLVLDVIGMDDTPGSIYHFPMREFRNLDSSENSDDTGVLGCLNILENKRERLPNVNLLAIVPDAIDEGQGLSPILKHSMEAYSLNIVKNIEKQGFSYQEKDAKAPIESIIEQLTV